MTENLGEGFIKLGNKYLHVPTTLKDYFSLEKCDWFNADWKM